MPTYTYQDALNVAQKMGKGVPFSGVDTTICDLVSSRIYKAYPWRDTLVVIPSPVALVDSTQDFSTGLTDIFRMTQFWIIRSDVTPNIYRDIDVAKSLSVDLVNKSPYNIRSASYQAGINKFRLESAVSIPSGSTFSLGGEYQPHPTKVSDMQDTVWFADEQLEVLAAGLLYWAYRLADDSRAGSASKVGDGPVQYTGQLAEFMSAIEDMAKAEDFGNIDGYYPDDSLGSTDGRRWYSNQMFPYLIS